MKQGPDGPSKLRAQIGREVGARLDAAPGVRRMPAANAQIYRCDAFLSAEECASLMALIDQDLRPSEVFAQGDWVTEFRSSRTCDFDIWHPQVNPIDARICALLGLPSANGEPPQGQRYDPGQQFRAHCDWFEGDQPYWPGQVKCGGQRTWTAMIYLNAVDEGGATWFPQAGVRFAPRPGMLIAWNNMRPDGAPNKDTIHEGMRVVEGAKYVLTKWFREGPWAYPGAN